MAEEWSGFPRLDEIRKIVNEDALHMSEWHCEREIARILGCVPADLARELYEALKSSGPFPLQTVERRKDALTRYEREVGE